MRGMRILAIALCCIGLVGVAHAGDPPPGIVVSITRDGKIFVAGREVPDDQLDARFHELAATSKDRRILIDADKAIERKRVDAIVARAKAAGLTHVTIGQAPRVAPPPRASH